jgi:hypothetical protein
MKPVAVGADAYLGNSPSNHYVRTARGRVPIESYSPELRRQFGIQSNAPYIPPSASGTSQPAAQQPTAAKTPQPTASAPPPPKAVAQPIDAQPAEAKPAQTANTAPVFLGTSPSNRYYETPQGLVPVEKYQSKVSNAGGKFRRRQR